MDQKWKWCFLLMTRSFVFQNEKSAVWVLAKNYVAQCLKIGEEVSFSNASEASYVYILTEQKFIKNINDCTFLENLRLKLNSVSRQVTFKRTKISGKCQNSKIQIRHFWLLQTMFYLRLVIYKLITKMSHLNFGLIHNLCLSGNTVWTQAFKVSKSRQIDNNLWPFSTQIQKRARFARKSQCWMRLFSNTVPQNVI